MSAFSKRRSNGSCSNVITAAPRRCATYVTTHEIITSTKNGVFSSTSEKRKPESEDLCNGQKSSSNITKGSVTSIGLDISHSAKKIKANQELRRQFSFANFM